MNAVRTGVSSFLAIATVLCVPHLLPAQEALKFAVVGHIRGPYGGGLNDLLGELVEEIRREDPDFVVVTGDLIWGDWVRRPVQRERVIAEWEAVDRELARIGKPTFRVPGNHDIHDLITRDVYRERYGQLPRAETIRGCRLLFMNSAWTPADGDGRDGVAYKGVPLDERQRAFLEEQLREDGSFDHAFVFMHHLLWWSGSAPWWTQVHALLKGSRVRAVFGGDFGPYKYSHLERDGIEYMHAVIATRPSVERMREMEEFRLLGQQLDCFLTVTLSPEAKRPRIEVHAVGARSTENFTPERWWSLYAHDNSLLGDIYRRKVNSPRAMLRAALVVAGVSFGAGVVGTIAVGWLVRRRRKRRAVCGALAVAPDMKR